MGITTGMGRKTRRWIPILVGLTLLVGAIWYWRRNETVEVHIASCRSNLQVIGSYLHLYSNKNNDYPASLSKLSELSMFSKTYKTSEFIVHIGRLLKCPANEDARKDSYTYLKLRSEIVPVATCIIAFDSEARHNGGRNVLYLDCHCEFVKENEFKERCLKMIAENREFYEDRSLINELIMTTRPTAE